MNQKALSLVHGIAHCSVCDWEDQGTDGRGPAYQHFKATGHRVHGELAYAYVYECEHEHKRLSRSGDVHCLDCSAVLK